MGVKDYLCSRILPCGGTGNAAQIVQLQNRINALNAQLNTATAALSECTGSGGLAVCAPALSQANLTIASLTSQLTTNNTSLVACQAQNVLLAEQAALVPGLQVSNAALNAQVVGLTTQLTASQAAQLSLSNQLASCQNSITVLTNQLAACTAGGPCSAQLASYQAQVSSLSAQVTSLNTQLAASQGSNTTLGAQVTSLSTQLAACQTALNNCQNPTCVACIING
jgi:chromosome segregation ATPase